MVTVGACQARVPAVSPDGGIRPAVSQDVSPMEALLGRRAYLFGGETAEDQACDASRSFGRFCSALRIAACHLPGRSSKVSASSSATWNSRRWRVLMSDSGGYATTFWTRRLRSALAIGIP